MISATGVGADGVVVSIPAQQGYLSLCRVNASAIGAMLGFGVDALDDLRLAVTEAVTWSLDRSKSGTRMELSVSGVDGQLHFAVVAEASETASADVDDLASAILGAMVDEFSTELEGGRTRLTFTKSTSSE